MTIRGIMKMVNTHINNKLMLLPDLPGCYLMKNKEKEIIYIGKAKNLKNAYVLIFEGLTKGKRNYWLKKL